MIVLNDVLNYDLKIYQNPDWFCFSLDSVILANFARVRLRTKRILDLGCGNGIIPLILSLRTKAFIEGVEIQKDLALLAEKSICYNNLESRIKIYHQDMKVFAKNKALYDFYDMIVCNPPYFKVSDKSTKNDDVHKVIARHEATVTLEEVIDITAKLLKEGGLFCTVNRVDRFMETLLLLSKYHLEPKYVRFVYDRIDIGPSMFYLEAIKGGKSGLTIDKPFVMYYKNKKTSEYDRLIHEVM